MNYSPEINLSNLTFFKYSLSFAQDYKNITFTDFWISGDNSATYICKWERINFIFLYSGFWGYNILSIGLQEYCFPEHVPQQHFWLYLHKWKAFVQRSEFIFQKDEWWNVSKMINPYFKLPNALHRSLLFPGRDPSFCGSTLLWCLWIQKHDFVSPVLPRKNTGSLPRPLSILMSEAYNSLIGLDGDAEELIDWLSQGEPG